MTAGAVVVFSATDGSPCPEGVLFTVNAPLARFAAAARDSVKMRVSDVPRTVAVRTVDAAQKIDEVKAELKEIKADIKALLLAQTPRRPPVAQP